MEKMQIVELEDDDYGYRFWSAPMPESEVSDYIARHAEIGYSLSDIDYPA